MCKHWLFLLPKRYPDSAHLGRNLCPRHCHQLRSLTPLILIDHCAASGLISAVRELLTGCKLYVLIRPRAGDFLYDAADMYVSALSLLSPVCLSLIDATACCGAAHPQPQASSKSSSQQNSWLSYCSSSTARLELEQELSTPQAPYCKNPTQR